MTTSAKAQGFLCHSVYSFDGRVFSKTDANIVREIPLQIILNDRKLVTIACSGLHLEELALGYLISERLIGQSEDIRAIRSDEEAGIVEINTAPGTIGDSVLERSTPTIASSGARSMYDSGSELIPEPVVDNCPPFAPDQVLTLMDRFIDACRLHRITRGTHGAALTDGCEILVVREDIGRHNTIDMLAGYALLNRLDCSDKALLRTGRVSAEIVRKVWNLGIPVIISLAVPTIQAIHLAENAQITLIGAVRGRSMQVYSHERRISL